MHDSTFQMSRMRERPNAIRPLRTMSKNREQPRPLPDVNILLLGPTGNGKTTFINALANYIAYDNLQNAVSGGMQVLIPSSFTFYDQERFECERINIGQEDEFERFSSQGQSCTQECRSFVFPIGRRTLRLIDTPGIGDTRGIDQDARNLQEIFATIANYDHLNAICILLKPNEERLTIPLRYCINELLRHLASSARENLVFIFTYARETFYRPGNTKKLLEELLKSHEQQQGVQIPLTTNSCFLFDNEPFRYLAIRSKGFQLNENETRSYEKSWEQSVTECLKFLGHVVRCPLHRIQDTISLNRAEELIRKLPRPLAEIRRQIEENIRLAQRYKRQILDKSLTSDDGLPQMVGHVQPLGHPRTVCTSDNCRQIINENNQQVVRYTSICHEHCYLSGVVQEVLGDPRLEDCEAFDYKSGKMNSFSVVDSSDAVNES